MLGDIAVHRIHRAETAGAPEQRIERQLGVAAPQSAAQATCAIGLAKTATSG
jgi:hypothetical protein